MSKENTFIRPPAVRKGDLVAVIAPCGAVSEERIAACVDLLQRMGLRAKVADSIYARRGYLAGVSDAAQGAAFTNAFADADVRAIICARGGYGSMRILEHVDWSIVKANPKVFCGYSDVTALHVALQQECRMVTFHGLAMPMSVDDAACKWNEESMLTAMTHVGALGQIRLPAALPAVETLVSGKVEGVLTGGNLTLLSALCGTKWQPNFAGKIALLEDIKEAPYRIDRLLTQLLLSSVFDGVKGIIFGSSPTCDVEPTSDGLRLREVIIDRLAPLGAPLIYGFPCGHTDYHATVPLGVPVVLDATAGSLTVLEPALEATGAT